MNTIKDSKVALVTTDAPGHERAFELMVWVDEVRLIELTREECARLGAMLTRASQSGKDRALSMVNEACLKMWNEADSKVRKRRRNTQSVPSGEAHPHTS